MMLSTPLLYLLQETPASPVWPLSNAEHDVVAATVTRAVVTAFVTLFLAGRVRHWFERATRGTRADASIRLLGGRILAILVLVIGAGTVLDLLGIPLSAMVTFIGVIGLAISLALQDIMKNLFAGLYLLFERPFRLGDVIAVKDQRGVVETIGIRTTTLRTDENVQVLIPNMTVFSEVVSNRTDYRPRPPEDTGSTQASADGPTAGPVGDRPPAR
jgi:small conductance mechanosensitive channel